MRDELDLTAELVARVHRTEADEGPRPDRLQMGDDDYADWAARLLAGHTGGPLRVFAYGSLIWKPEFEFAAQARARLAGWHRSFCMKIERWRGTRAVPGLMMALDTGGHCDGVVYDLIPGDPAQQLDRLLRREMTNKPPTNVPFWVEVQTATGSVSALAFRSAGHGVSYRGGLSAAEVASVLARAAGHWGSGAEYLFNTVSHLERMDIHDDHLWELQKLVAAEIRAMTAV